MYIKKNQSESVFLHLIEFFPKENTYGFNPLHYSWWKYQSEYVLLKFVYMFPTTFNEINTDCSYPVHAACQYNLIELVAM